MSFGLLYTLQDSLYIVAGSETRFEEQQTSNSHPMSFLAAECGRDSILRAFPYHRQQGQISQEREGAAYRRPQHA